MDCINCLKLPEHVYGILVNNTGICFDKHKIPKFDFFEIIFNAEDCSNSPSTSTRPPPPSPPSEKPWGMYFLNLSIFKMKLTKI